MKKAILIVLSCCMAYIAAAQPKAVGIRTGINCFEASYEHTTFNSDFIEAELGLDFGYAANGRPGIKISGIYNFTLARPAWTERGTWALYAGPGMALGYVNDMVRYQVENIVAHPVDHGFMFAVAGQAGLEYTFWFPLQLSIDMRPYFGFHINDGKAFYNHDGIPVKYASKVGFYNNGLFGFIPSVSVRYRF